MKRSVLFFLPLACCVLFVTAVFSQSPVPMASQPGISYTENFADIANWTNGFASGIGANRFLPAGINGQGNIPDGIRINTETTSFVINSNSGVQKGTLQTVPSQSIVLLAVHSIDNFKSTAIDFYMDFTGVNAGKLSFDWRSVNNSTGNRNASLRVYASHDDETFSEIPAAQVLNFTNNLPTFGSIVNVNLPASFNNQPYVKLRFYCYNGIGGTLGSQPKISIDNLTVTAVSAAPTAAHLSLGGRLLASNGRGIKGAMVTILGGNLKEPVRTVTNPFGYYNFEGLEAGLTYVVTVSAKRFIFTDPSRVVTLGDNLSNIDFVAEDQF